MVEQQNKLISLSVQNKLPSSQADIPPLLDDRQLEGIKREVDLLTDRWTDQLKKMVIETDQAECRMEIMID